MLFDDPSSSSPEDGGARQQVATQQVARTPATAAAAPIGNPQALADRMPSARTHDPRLIETAGAPAPEALRATEIAAVVVRELYDSGREVRFAFVPTRKRVAVLLCDTDGAVLTRLTPARALEIATGEAIPGARRR